jgi:uncharacterized membrane protein YraQ (UPF0718 family)
MANSLNCLPQQKQQEPISRPGSGLGFYAETIFLLSALGLLIYGLLGSGQARINTLAINFVALLLEALPFLFIGALAGGLIEVFVPRIWFDRLLGGRSRRVIFIGAALGLILPVCECVVIPVVRRLLKKGVPFSAAVAYLLGGPVVNSIVAASTAVAYSYDWQMVALRLGCGYFIAVLVAFIIGFLFDDKNALLPLAEENSTCSCGCNCGSSTIDGNNMVDRLRQAIRCSRDDFFEVGRYLIIGSFIASFMRSMISINTFQNLMAAPWLAILLMMALAIILNVCSEADAFIAAGFRGSLPA